MLDAGSVYSPADGRNVGVGSTCDVVDRLLRPLSDLSAKRARLCGRVSLSSAALAVAMTEPSLPSPILTVLRLEDSTFGSRALHGAARLNLSARAWPVHVELGWISQPECGARAALVPAGGKCWTPFSVWRPHGSPSDPGRAANKQCHGNCQQPAQRQSSDAPSRITGGCRGGRLAATPSTRRSTATSHRDCSRAYSSKRYSAHRESRVDFGP